MPRVTVQRRGKKIKYEDSPIEKTEDIKPKNKENKKNKNKNNKKKDCEKECESASCP